MSFAGIAALERGEWHRRYLGESAFRSDPTDPERSCTACKRENSMGDHREEWIAKRAYDLWELAGHWPGL
ncbi:DUF2934 domain-containing protein [Neorhizobium petrolearium]